MSETRQEIQLAIVIPAYKAKYLPETLDSLVAQTDKRFHVYIGDDKSPEDIETIVKRYDQAGMVIGEAAATKDYGSFLMTITWMQHVLKPFIKN